MRERPETAWALRAASGAGPIPNPGPAYPRTIKVEDLRQSHPDLYEKYMGHDVAEAPPPPAAAIASLLETPALERDANDEDLVHPEEDDRDYVDDSSPEATREREEERRDGQLALASVVIRSAFARAEAAVAARSAVIAKVPPDADGNVVDPDTGEVVAGPGSAEAARDRAEVVALGDRDRDDSDPRGAELRWPGATRAYCTAAVLVSARAAPFEAE